MAESLALNRYRFFKNDGTSNPLSGGKLYTYEAGTSTNKDTYTSQAGTATNANPIILDSNGEKEIWFGTGSYKLVLKDSSDAIQWTIDNLNASGSASGNNITSISDLRTLSTAFNGFIYLQGYYAPDDGGEGMFYWSSSSTLTDNGGTIIKPTSLGVTDPGRWIRVVDDVINAKWFGAKGDGVTNDSTSINNARIFVNSLSSGGTLVFNAGSYLLTTGIMAVVPPAVYTDIIFDSNINIVMNKGAKFLGAGVIIRINGQLTAGSYQIFDVAMGNHLLMAGTCDYADGMWFGAVGNSTTDDTNAVQRIISMVASWAGEESVSTVHFPNGRYKITKTIGISSNNVIIEGEGRRSSWFHVAPSSPSSVTSALKWMPALSAITADPALNLFTYTNHGYANGSKIQFSTAPTGVSTATNYFVIWKSLNTFKIATTKDNAQHDVAVDFSGSQSSTTTATDVEFVTIRHMGFDYRGDATSQDVAIDATNAPNTIIEDVQCTIGATGWPIGIGLTSGYNSLVKDVYMDKIRKQGLSLSVVNDSSFINCNIKGDPAVTTASTRGIYMSGSFGCNIQGGTIEDCDWGVELLNSVVSYDGYQESNTYGAFLIGNDVHLNLINGYFNQNGTGTDTQPTPDVHSSVIGTLDCNRCFINVGNIYLNGITENPKYIFNLQEALSATVSYCNVFATSSSVSATVSANVFTIATGHSFVAGDRVYFSAGAFGASPTIESGKIYYVRAITATTFTVSATLGGAEFGTNNATSANVFYDAEFYYSDRSIQEIGGIVADPTAETFQRQGHKFRNEDPIVFSSAPTGITASTIVYYVYIRNHSGVTADAGTDAFTKTAHGFQNGEVVKFSTSGVTEISTGGTYYIVGRTANTFQVSLTSGGSAVDLVTVTGQSTLTLHPDYFQIVSAPSIIYTDATSVVGFTGKSTFSACAISTLAGSFQSTQQRLWNKGSNGIVTNIKNNNRLDAPLIYGSPYIDGNLYIGGTLNVGTNVQAERTSTGGTLKIQVNNTDDTSTASQAQLSAKTHASGGDSSLFLTNTTGNFSLGIDTSDSSKLKLSKNEAVGTTPVFETGTGADYLNHLVGQAFPSVLKSANYTLTNADMIVSCDAVGGAFTITLPTFKLGALFIIKKIDASANAVTISGGGVNIDGSASNGLLSAQWDTQVIVGGQIAGPANQWIIVYAN